MTKPKRPPTNREFNAAVLDRVLEQALPADQRDDEISVGDLVARGMSESSARRFCESACKHGSMARRIGWARGTRRRVWLYRMKPE